MKVCLARVDRIGDLILTLPCEKIWLEKRPEDEVFWLVNENLRFVVESAEPKPRALFVRSTQGVVHRLREAFVLARVLRLENVEHTVALHVPWWVALAFWLAGIKKRTGTVSQWFSFLFFNHKIRQKRSRAEKHESEYNRDLVEFALGEKIQWGEARQGEGVQRRWSTVSPARLKADPEKVSRWKADLQGLGVNTNRMVVIHAGMAGSARNWPAQNYRRLAERLIGQNVNVVITGGPVDKTFLSEAGLTNIPGVVNLVEKTPGEEILAVLSQARAVVVPSTGVAHMAASLGVAVAGLYSPVKVQAPKRWAPLGPEVKVFVPEVNCPGHFECLGKPCPLYDCLEQIQVDSVFAYVMDKL